MRVLLLGVTHKDPPRLDEELLKIPHRPTELKIPQTELKIPHLKTKDLNSL